MSYREEFPIYFHPPEILTNLPGFEDSSWRNDAMPHFTHAEAPGLELWCDAETQDNSEIFFDSDPAEWRRFALFQGSSEDDNLLFATNDAEEMRKKILEVINEK